MNLTENKAKERWCPYARALSEVKERWWHRLWPFPINRGRFGNPAMNTECLASGCMAWRWGPDDAALNEQMHGQDATPETGYCGLAGKPEA